LMNTKGLIELIVLNIGLEYKIISPKVFTMMVVMALVCTIMTSPIVHYLYPLQRVLEFEAKGAGKSSWILTIRDRESVPAYMKLIDVIAKARPKKWRIFGIRIIGLQDKPSAYMKDLHDDEVLQYAVDCCNIMNFKLKPVPLGYDDKIKSLIMHIDHVAFSNSAQFIFLHWDANDSEHPSSSTMGGSTIFAMSRIARNSLAVLIDRGLAEGLTKLCFVYCGTVHDTEALKLVRPILAHKVVQVKIICLVSESSEEEGNPYEDIVKLKKKYKELEVDIVSKTNPTPHTLKLVRNYEPELIITGVIIEEWDKNNSVGFCTKELIVGTANSKCSVLAVQKITSIVDPKTAEIEIELHPPKSSGSQTESL